jgi:predicted  nucleic acid-binding Zn-ribbon protein
MSSQSETNTLKKAKSIGNVISSLTQLPGRINAAAFLERVSKLEDKLSDIDKEKKKLTAMINEKDAELSAVKFEIVDIRDAVKGSYGANSTEYELGGGKRTSDRKKPTSKPKAAKA